MPSHQCPKVVNLPPVFVILSLLLPEDPGTICPGCLGLRVTLKLSA